ncbi:O-antigen ligase family protein [Desulfolithobacter dissulfuricans]|uniref:O-antigen ligase family protein n=1 Tax=Desulfolithobacter dissulfuricans TaxID=2795293 RepID=UPI0022784DA8|nr:O-antigen ligase family protein [Desulfolithobacter dissulfuricans]
MNYKKIGALVSLPLVIVVTLIILFGDFITAVSNLSVLSILDDAMVMSVFALIVLAYTYRLKVSILAVIWISTLIALTFCSLGSVYSRGLVVSFLASLLYCKIFQFFVVASEVRTITIHKVIFVVTVVHLLGFALNILFPEFFVSLQPDVSYELDTSRIVGFEINPNRFGALSTVLFLFYMFVRKNRLLSLLLLAGLIMSWSRSSLLLCVLSSYYFYIAIKQKIIYRILSTLLIIMVPVIFVLFGRGIDQDLKKAVNTYEGDQKYIRVAMLISGATLAKQHFPLGTGGGTFGSPLSLGSKVYDELGIADWSSVKRGTGIHDSGIGSLLGEYGIIGLFTVLVLLYCMFEASSHSMLRRTDLLFLLGIILFFSLFRAVISSYFYSLIVFVVFLILNYIREQMAVMEKSLLRALGGQN